MVKKIIELFSKYWYYLLIFLILIIVCLFLVLNSKSKVEPNQVIKYDNKIVLFGEKSISIKQGEEYIEPGFYALIDGKIIQDEVKVDNNIDKSMNLTCEMGNIQVAYSGYDADGVHHNHDDYCRTHTHHGTSDTTEDTYQYEHDDEDWHDDSEHDRNHH